LEKAAPIRDADMEYSVKHQHQVEVHSDHTYVGGHTR